MKTKTLISHYLFVFILFGMVNCRNAQTQKESQSRDNFSDEQIVSMLKNFYTSYTLENFKRPPLYNQDKVDSIKHKYCTDKLLNDIHKQLLDGLLDYDPFTHAQMFDSNTLETLTIRKDDTTINLYYISFIWTYEKKRITIKLSVIKENRDFKIDHIFLEDFKEESMDPQIIKK